MCSGECSKEDALLYCALEYTPNNIIYCILQQEMRPVKLLAAFATSYNPKQSTLVRMYLSYCWLIVK